MNKKEDRPKRWVGCPVETEYFGDDRKLAKQERKTAKAKDRSKYKKTDLDKRITSPEETSSITEEYSRGRVLSITSQGILVDHEGTTMVCTLRGVLKKEATKFKNLVVVGDFVRCEQVSPGEGIIHQVEPRFSILSRSDPLSQRKEHLIAANIDQVFITMSVVEPPLKPFLVDRYIIAARKGGMTPIIVVNKIDLLQDEDSPVEVSEKELYEEFLKAYAIAEVPVISASVTTNEGIENLKEAMRGKASVFSGQSGVGKSSLINLLAGLELSVGSIVERTKKGTHTTTTACLLKMPFGGWCIDTPGIKSFGVWDLKVEEIESYFAEIHACGTGCKFQRCSHLQEPECAVKQAVETGLISELRYASYLYLVESVKSEHKRR